MLLEVAKVLSSLTRLSKKFILFRHFPAFSGIMTSEKKEVTTETPDEGKERGEKKRGNACRRPCCFDNLIGQTLHTEPRQTTRRGGIQGFVWDYGRIK